MSDRQIKVLYFAWVREKVGRSEETLSVPTDVATVANLVSWLCGRGPEYANAFAAGSVIRAAIDQTHVTPETPLGGAREIAFFPPVTGG